MGDTNDNGLVIFVRRVPAQFGEAVLRSYLEPHLAAYGILAGDYELQKPSDKGVASLHIASTPKGERFLAAMEQRPVKMSISRFPFVFERHKIQDGGATIRDHEFIARAVADASRKPDLADQMKSLDLDNQPQQQLQLPEGEKTFLISTIRCGYWWYEKTGSPVFVSEYSSSQPGKILVGHRAIVVVLSQATSPRLWVRRIDFEWDFIDMIYTQRGDEDSILITCKYAPRMFSRNEMDVLMSFLSSKNQNSRNKMRISMLDPAHGKVAGTCLTYELVLQTSKSIHTIRKLIEHMPNRLATMRTRVKTVVSKAKYNDSLAILDQQLSKSQLPFVVKFQAMKLALNGHLPPHTICNEIIGIAKQALAKGRSNIHVAEALRQLDRDLPWPGPQTPYVELKQQAVEGLLQKLMYGSLTNSPTYWSIKKNDNLALIHHVSLTPAGVYLDGPDPEVINRVLRSYQGHTDNFMRVTFSDEDGDPLQFRFDVANDLVYEKFQQVLDNSIPLCGKSFEFLGFSQSSLRSHTAWFMSPFPLSKHGDVLTPKEAIRRLGDFSHFRSPAKCAARIGQAFTDTSNFLTVRAAAEVEIPDVERNGRVFSDGCGTLSEDLAYEIFLKYDSHVMRVPPTVFQIRFRGCKGVLSVDPNLGESQLRVRPSMRKFQTPDDDTHNLEICGMADKVRPLSLNRGLIKVLEDLDVPHEGFLQLAEEELERLRLSIRTVEAAARLLEDEQVGTSAGFPDLLRRMKQIGIDLRKDRTLCAVVEMAAFCRLRAMKYKGRIRVRKGVKLMGIMDETGLLKEGEIHVAWIDDDDVRVIHTGLVAVTRSPTIHPGDVQLAKAVDVPLDSPLRKLYNCVIFSQHGDRDLPSQLGGGDLDGDLYDVFWDPRILPRTVARPAEYARPRPVDVGREIVTGDITKHFVDFMKNNNVGILANHLLALSDRTDGGTRAKDCVGICELISTALDYPKTGVVANMKSMPRIDKTWRPDFMAPSPKVKIEKAQDPLAIAFDDAKDPNNQYGGERAALEDPVAALDPNERKTRYYKSTRILGKLYRMVDEQGFYKELQSQTAGKHRGESVLLAVLKYAKRATVGIAYEQHLQAAREVREMYEGCVHDVAKQCTVHTAQSLHELEVVTGAVLGSVCDQRLRERAMEMRERVRRDLAYVREQIRGDGEDGNAESVPRSLACLTVALEDGGGRKRKGTMCSFGYVAAGVCLEEIANWYGGRLPAV
ncbi:uncharacterized protein PV09_07630 [Verruconis gallopava]|uniref:RNA-dependent RNA polymerase n=1 Tax=Verruconis gallopava TaxID=253628 RepID=A0A0D2AP31_9PEZI|nr:uncharacterized protein PV09_07630 [Verruconis gallopava]KIW00874.1 hypothetical protein PV09_07630 [Verruconis gallopava]